MSPMSRAEALTQAAHTLHACGIAEAVLDTEWLLAGTCACSRTELLLAPHALLTEPEQERFAAYVTRRAQREPLQYILGTQEFYGLTLQVTPDVLIPRPETEELVAWILAEYATTHRTSTLVHILDIGTGSGCIACALATAWPHAHVTALDTSHAALAVAARNITALHLTARIALVQGDSFPPQSTPFDLIVSNPPYIPTHVVPTLEPEVAAWEPRMALDGGADGLAVIRAIIDTAPAYLQSGGGLFLEIGHDQAAAVTSYLRKTENFAQVRTARDIAGIERFIFALRH